uniref:Uncharacterized protein n=1 Tax=Entomoneis paludosa TaxID=265537 RepID=A0A7S2VA87_9STRA|mmetsp:Transcript_13441/g.27831  ORF Transcript_13441/g.27831 Transcript_13441/m.27831 type:complete len:182 (+) Transcript_13441:116-661(+)
MIQSNLNLSIFHMDVAEKSPTLPVHASIYPCKEAADVTGKHAVTIAKPRSPARLMSPPPRLRRTKSLPTHFEASKSDKSLFWFRPHPDRPLHHTPPRQTRTKETLRHHRRVKTSPPPYIPKELSLPTLREEEPPQLKPAFMRNESSTTEFSSIFDSTLYSDDEEEDELDLRGLSLLEGRDE